MKNRIKDIIKKAALDAFKAGEFSSDQFPEVVLEKTRNSDHGDFSTNVAMQMAKSQKMAPRKIAEALIGKISDEEGLLQRVEIAGPGFINFFINTEKWYPVLSRIHAEDGNYGASTIGSGKRVQVEFVSANPTGPLHVGHGRGAVVGDAVASVLSFCGFDVQREYYINDAGNQIRTLGLSVYLRMKESQGEALEFPADCYQGDYIKDIARDLLEKEGSSLLEKAEADAISICSVYAGNFILEGIREDLENFGIVFDNWFSEKKLFDSGKVAGVIEDLKAREIIYEKDGASWFNTSAHGDDKDRIVIKSDGVTTYFASDIAYHQDKYDRGFDRVIDVWGADHHGYVTRINAAIEACGHDSDNFDVILVQLVALLRDGQPVSMSTRSGEFETLKDVVDEVGRDAARFIFLTRHYESPLDFDLSLAKKKSNDNPVFYVQYVHARISSIAEKARTEMGIDSPAWNDEIASILKEPEEINLIKALFEYPEVVEQSAINMEPHRVTYYLMNLASLFHSYYNRHKVVTGDETLTAGRLYLVLAVKKVIANGLTLLGVSAPEKM